MLDVARSAKAGIAMVNVIREIGLIRPGLWKLTLLCAEPCYVHPKTATVLVNESIQRLYKIILQAYGRSEISLTHFAPSIGPYSRPIEVRATCNRHVTAALKSFGPSYQAHPIQASSERDRPMCRQRHLSNMV